VLDTNCTYVDINADAIWSRHGAIFIFQLQYNCDHGGIFVIPIIMRSRSLYCIILSKTRQSQPHCYFCHIQLSCDRGHCAIIFSYQTIEATVLFIFIPTTTQSRPQCHFLFISTYHTIEGTVLFLLFPLQLPYNRGHVPTFFHFQQL
jgi:hypothetical protein